MVGPHVLLHFAATRFMLFYIPIYRYHPSSPRPAKSPGRSEFAFDGILQRVQCFTSVSCSFPSKQPSRRQSVSSNTAHGPSSPLPKDRVLADCTSLTWFLVSQTRMLHLARLTRIPLAAVMFADMYGRVKAELTTAEESSQKSKAS